MNNCYSLTGPFPLYIIADPVGSGTIKINSLTITDLPWSGNYHGGIPIKISAVPDSLNGFDFSHWSTLNNTVMPSPLLQNAELNISVGDTLIAHFTQQPVSVEELPSSLNAVAYPSVFNEWTTIEFYQKKDEKLKITLINSLGQPVYFITGNNAPGINRFTMNGALLGLSPGVYLVNFRSSNTNETLRLIYTGE
jgi:hypothetical protein